MCRSRPKAVSFVQESSVLSQDYAFPSSMNLRRKNFRKCSYHQSRRAKAVSTFVQESFVLSQEMRMIFPTSMDLHRENRGHNATQRDL